MALASSAEGGVGITLGSKVGGASTYTNYTQVMDDMEFDGFDTTTILIKLLASAAVNKRAGRTDFGNLTGSMYLVMGDTSVVAFLALASTKALVNWQLQLVDDLTTPANSSTATFSGFVQNVKPGNFSGEDAPTLDFTIAIDGAVTFAAGT